MDIARSFLALRPLVEHALHAYQIASDANEALGLAMPIGEARLISGIDQADACLDRAKTGLGAFIEHATRSVPDSWGDVLAMTNIIGLAAELFGSDDKRVVALMTTIAAGVAHHAPPADRLAA